MPKIQYQTDDCVFDLEIRENFFVCGQYYPEQNLYVCSYLEELKPDFSKIENQEPKLQPESKSEKSNLSKNKLIELNAELTDEQKPVHAAKQTSNSQIKTKTQKNWQTGFLQNYYINDETDYKIKQKPEVLEQARDLIRKKVSDFKDTEIRFENLANLDDFLNFVKRYGYSNSKIKLNHTKLKRQFGDYRVVYDTDNDYDQEKHGIRLGYNSENYDQTFIAHYLGSIMKQTINDAANPTKSLQETQNDFYTAVINPDNGNNEQATPEMLTAFNSLMFRQNQMWQALDKNEAESDTAFAWKVSNRFVDVSALNPKRISLKRCAMALGYRIEESSSNRNPSAPLETLQDVLNVIAYNANDIYVTMKIFESPDYHNRYLQNQQLLKEFPYLVYEQNQKSDKKIAYIKGEDHIDYGRINVNATSTKFVTKVIAPYENTKIEDNKTLNLMYPDAKIAKKLDAANKLPKSFHGKPKNVLDYIQKLLNEDYQTLPTNIAKKAQAEFEKIKTYYRQFEGQNFNEDINQNIADPATFKHKPPIIRYTTIKPMHRDNHNVGTACYAKVSIGGVHGVEVKEDLFQKDIANYQTKVNRFQKTCDWFNQQSGLKFQEPVTIDNLAQTILNWDAPNTPLAQVLRRPLPFDESTTFKDLVASGISRKHPEKAKLKTIKEVKLFDSKGLREQYSYCSYDLAHHADFDSYYPSLISMLAIFRNADGKDVFTEDLYHPRLDLKMKAKKKGEYQALYASGELTEQDAKIANLRQLSMKLLINSASGAGDMKYSNNIKCNNKMIAMRIMGQLFCWYIGQSLAFKNARIPSINTDGLYSMSINQTTNDQIVFDCAKRLLLKIDPEIVPLFVSKDANNRLETTDTKIEAARGGALTSWQGPSTQNAIDHPAIIDWILSQYLAFEPDAVNKPFNYEAAKQIFASFFKEPEITNWFKTYLYQDHVSYAQRLRFLQFPIVANPSKYRFSFTKNLKTGKIELLGLTNRVFLTKQSKSDVTIKSTALSTVQKGTVNKRLKAIGKTAKSDVTFRDLIIDYCNKEAVHVIKQNASDREFKQLLNQTYNPNATVVEKKPRDLQIKKIKMLENDQPITLYNEDLHDVDKVEYQNIVKLLDGNAYIKIVADVFEKQWQN